MAMTNAERLEYQRRRRAETGNAWTLKYERTKAGKLMRIYRNMRSRIEGVQKKKFHLYRGKSLMPKEQFYLWANNSNEFHRLFREWEESGFERRLAPSVDRIDSDLGYELGNLQWVTQSENSRRGSNSRHHGPTKLTLARAA